MVEKKELPKTEKSDAPKKEVKKSESKPEPKPEPKPETPESEKSGKSNKKINRMTLAEIESQLEEIKSSMGGHSSKYAQHLIRRKNLLTAKS
ncbi:MAG: hypothetical protein WCC06_07205 [Candidatus Aminicenantales bacterium]